MIATAETEPDALYDSFQPSLPLGLPFARMAVAADWSDWPSLPDLFPVSFPGVKTSRDSFLIDVDLDRLKARLSDYFDSEVGHEEMARRHPVVMSPTRIFDARAVRDALLERGGPVESAFVRHAYRPFDTRWLYWEADSGLLDRPRPEYEPHVMEGNLWLGSNKREIDSDFSHGTAIRHLGNWKLGNWGIHFIPAWLRDDGLGVEATDGPPRRPNLSPAAHSYLERLGLDVEDLFHHVLAVLHDPAYREANAGALRMEWPRIPLPGWPDGDDAAAELAASAARGRKLAALLDPDTPVPGVTEPRPGAPSGNALRPEIAEIAVPSTIDDTNMTGDDFALTAGWGHLGQGEAVMPGQGRAIERPHTAPEQAALPSVVPALSRNPVPVPHDTGDDAHTPGDTTTPRTEDDAALPPVIPALSRNPVRRVRPPRHRPHTQRSHPHPRRHHLRHLPKRPSLLAKRPRRRLELQTRRLPGPQKVALLPRTKSPPPPPTPRRSPTLHQHRPPHICDTRVDGRQLSRGIRSYCHVRCQEEGAESSSACAARTQSARPRGGFVKLRTL